jgi:hypothetical protein
MSTKANKMNVEEYVHDEKKKQILDHSGQSRVAFKRVVTLDDDDQKSSSEHRANNNFTTTTSAAQQHVSHSAPVVASSSLSSFSSKLSEEEHHYWGAPYYYYHQQVAQQAAAAAAAVNGLEKQEQQLQKHVCIRAVSSDEEEDFNLPTKYASSSSSCSLGKYCDLHMKKKEPFYEGSATNTSLALADDEAASVLLMLSSR